MTEKPLIYLIMGAPGSGRRDLVNDLVQSGLDKDENVLVLVSAKEQPLTGDRAAGANPCTTQNWDWSDGKLNIELPGGFSRIFLITEGNLSPVDQMEAFADWLPGREVELGRIITIVHCRLASQHKELLRWYEACIHFSDVVLLNRREEVPQKWISDFLDHFKKEHYPCLFEQVKNGKVSNPALVLEPEPRRISLLFDELPELDPGEAAGDDEADDGGDPYLARQRSGRREKQVPDIKDYLE